MSEDLVSVKILPRLHQCLSYHDLYISTENIARTSIFDLPFNLMVTCTRAGGWELWDSTGGVQNSKLLASAYSRDKWLVLDVDGFVIVDGRENISDESEEGNENGTK